MDLAGDIKDHVQMSSLFYIGPVMGWSSVEETRLLVDVGNEVTLMCELFVGDEYMGSYNTNAYPGIPIVYVLYNLPPSVPCRIVWNGEVEIAFRVTKRVRMPMEINDDFPLVKYVRCNVGVYSATVYGLGQIQTIHEKMVFITGNRMGGIGSWENLARERPNLIVHTGSHINLHVVHRLSTNRTIAVRNAWRRIRELYRDAWSASPIRSLLATVSNIFSVNVQPFHNHHLIRMQRDDMIQLVRSVCGPITYSTNNISLEYEDVVFLTTMIYQEVLWRDIPHYYDGAFKHFAAGGKTIFLLDTVFHCASDTFLGHNQLAAIDNTLALSQRGSSVVLVASSDPFTKRKTDFNQWASKKKWLDEFARILSNAQHHRLAWVCGIDGRQGKEVVYYCRGMVVLGYILPSIRSIDEGVHFKRVHKRIAQFKSIHSKSIRKSGYLTTEYEPIEMCT